MLSFNNQGELNASSFKDALVQLTKYASILEDNVPSNLSLSGQPRLSDNSRDEIIARAIETHEGKYALAQAMANPIRTNLDYQGIGRRVLEVDPIAQGALAVYDRDIDVAATVISSNGTGPESRVMGDRVTVPEFEIYSNPTVRIAEVKRRRFNVLDRAVQKARQEIMAQEDANTFAAIHHAAQVENTASDIQDSGLTRRDLLQIKKSIDGWDNITTKFLMNINEFTDMLDWQSGGGGDVDPVTHREILKTGLLAHIWGADILVSKIVPAGTIYGCADPDMVGVMAVRQDIEVLPADEPKQLRLGWVVSEIIGIGILNPRGVAMGSKSVLVNP